MTSKQFIEFQKLIDSSIREAHLSGLQSGKKENSGLVDMVMHKLENSIETSINKNVNGKINVLTQKLDDYIESDYKWKTEYEPYLKGIANLTGSGKIIIGLVGGLSVIIGFLISIKNYLK